MRSGIGMLADGVRDRHLAWNVFVAVVAVVLALFVLLAAPVLAAEEPEDAEPRVVGGTAVPDGRYPFMVSLQAPFGIPNRDGHFCGGTLIDSDSVLTAAHCIREVPVTRRNFRDVRLEIGGTVLTRDQGQVRRIARYSDIKVHPRYGNFTYDAAVIELDSPVRGIRPIRLVPVGSDSLERPGSAATVAGWGNRVRQSPSFAEPDRYPNRMLEARVPIVSDERAGNAYASVSPRYRPPLMLAAGRRGKDTCQGDSGGPLFKRTAGGYVQIGITSFGVGCATARYPGVYAEVGARSIGAFVRAEAR